MPEVKPCHREIWFGVTKFPQQISRGNIDNFLPVRQRLEGQGHEIRSETDSEVICHLIESHGEGNIVEATNVWC